MCSIQLFSLSLSQSYCLYHLIPYKNSVSSSGIRNNFGSDVMVQKGFNRLIRTIALQTVGRLWQAIRVVRVDFNRVLVEMRQSTTMGLSIILIQQVTSKESRQNHGLLSIFDRSTAIVAFHAIRRVIFALVLQAQKHVYRSYNQPIFGFLAQRYHQSWCPLAIYRNRLKKERLVAEKLRFPSPWSWVRSRVRVTVLK